jgi:4-hydroxy-3-methylbut-2-en-1-yl diphosphate reductase
VKIEKAKKTGFCFGVRRALDILEKVAGERGGVETLGEVVHNQQVLQKLHDAGVRVAHNIDDISGDTVVIGAHGVSPKVIEELKARQINIIDTTCPFVHRAQIAARRLAKAGFFVIIFGEADHPEVRGVLGWANDKGLAITDTKVLRRMALPRRLGVLSQTTQIPDLFVKFVTSLIKLAYTKDSEIRITDTICHDIRERQFATLDLSKKVDLMLVVGGRNSANTSHLTDLAAKTTRAIKIEAAADIKPEWFENCEHIGVTAGASTADETIEAVMLKLASINK